MPNRERFRHTRKGLADGQYSYLTEHYVLS
jgi:hypothetical protein